MYTENLYFIFNFTSASEVKLIFKAKCNHKITFWKFFKMLTHLKNRKNKKSPRSISPRRCSPYLQSAKYTTITQDTIPSGVPEVCDEYLFGRGKNRESGASDREKKPRRKRRGKMGITTPVLTAG